MTRHTESMPSIERGTARSHNYYIRLVWDVVPRSLAVPAGTMAGRGPHITSMPKPWQSLARGVVDSQAAEPVELHLLRFRDGQQGIGHELVSGEDGVIVAGRHRAMVAP